MNVININNRSRRFIVLIGLIGSLAWTPREGFACSTILVGKEGAGAVERFLNTYAEHCLTQVGYAYHELVDYLMFRYLLDHSEVAPPKLPAISAPMIPAVPDN
jgi:hypothetical protein